MRRFRSCSRCRRRPTPTSPRARGGVGHADPWSHQGSDRHVARGRLRRACARCSSPRPSRASPPSLPSCSGTSGGSDNLKFLIEALLTPGTAEDAQWSIVDSLLFFDPGVVTRQAVTQLRQTSGAAHAGGLHHRQASRRRADERGSALSDVVPQVRLDQDARRGAQGDGATRQRRTIAATASGLPPTRGTRWRSRRICHKTSCSRRKRTSGRCCACYALESLRLIGDEGSIKALRDARNWRPDGGAADRSADQLMQLSYEVSEDVYWRVTGGREGDFYDPAERPSNPR